MSFNPYNSQRYLNTINRLPTSRQLPPKSGMSFADLQRYRAIRQEVEEANRRQYWEDQYGFLHSSARRAMEAGLWQESVKGLSDCTHGFWDDVGGGYND